MSTPAATLVLLSELGSLPPNTKVRFVGCIQHYNTHTGTLTLVSSFPTARINPTNSSSGTASSKITTEPTAGKTTIDTISGDDIQLTEPPRTTHAHVSTSLIPPPPHTSSTLFEAGSWINVIGYTTLPPTNSNGVDDAGGAVGHVHAHVQGTLLFAARSADVGTLIEGTGGAGEGEREGRYEAAVRGRRGGLISGER